MSDSTFFDEVTQEVLSRGSCLRFTVNGNSMAPFVRDGDIIHVEPMAADRLRVGDIVFYRRPGGKHTVHRLIRKDLARKPATLITRGDNMRHSDGPVSLDQVLGRTTLIESRGRELPLDGVASRAMSALLLHFSRGDGYAPNAVRRLASKLCWTIGGRRARWASPSE